MHIQTDSSKKSQGYRFQRSPGTPLESKRIGSNIVNFLDIKVESFSTVDLRLGWGSNNIFIFDIAICPKLILLSDKGRKIIHVLQFFMNFQWREPLMVLVCQSHGRSLGHSFCHTSADITSIQPLQSHIIPCGLLWSSMVYYGPLWHSTAPYGPLWFS